MGWLDQPTPAWVWLVCVLGLDVTHVWSTIYRVYLDRTSFFERPLLFIITPLAAWLVGVMIHHQSAALFWRLLAYFAVFHFVRQQYGWLRLYQRRVETRLLDRRLETTAIYTATLFPLFWWHTQLPRGFTWFMEGDFVNTLATPALQTFATNSEPLYWAVLATYILRQVVLSKDGTPPAWGKIQLITSTWLCWWLGIMALNSDFTFTVTNVIIHAVPYFVLTYRYSNLSRQIDGKVKRSGVVSVALFLAPLLVLAFLEEGLWDRFVWLDHSELFGNGHEASMQLKNWLVPLLATPQLTHYILDGFIWRGSVRNARFLSMVLPKNVD